MAVFFKKTSTCTNGKKIKMNDINKVNFRFKENVYYICSNVMDVVKKSHLKILILPKTVNKNTYNSIELKKNMHLIRGGFMLHCDAISNQIF
jgi:hypothetical protein